MNRTRLPIGSEPRTGRQKGAEIRRRREAMELSVPQFAARIGITPQSLSNIELGNKGASIELLVRIAGQFGCALDAIVVRDAA